MNNELGIFDYKKMALNELVGPLSKKKKRIGRGIGSGSGKTSGKGHKGQRSRAGARRSNIFQGGQMPLERRLPKRGFRSLYKKDDHIISLSELNFLNDKNIFKDKNIVTINDLIEAKIINPGQKVKLLSDGEIQNFVSVETHKISKNAREKIEAVGGKIIIINS